MGSEIFDYRSRRYAVRGILPERLSRGSETAGFNQD
jgi:hypothetical protein